MAATLSRLPRECVEMIASFCPLDDILSLGAAGAEFEWLRRSPLIADRLCATWPDLRSLRGAPGLDWHRVHLEVADAHAVCRATIRRVAEDALAGRDVAALDRQLGEYEGRGRLYVRAYLERACSRPVVYERALVAPPPDRFDLTHRHCARALLDRYNQLELRAEPLALLRAGDGGRRATAERALAFFAAWVEPRHGEPGGPIRAAIRDLTNIVLESLPPDHPFHKIDAAVKNSWEDCLLDDNQYTPEVSIELIKLIQSVLKRKAFITEAEPTVKSYIVRKDYEISSNSILSGIYFESVLRRFGVRCDVVYFDNHHLLVWRESWAAQTPVYLLNPFTGAMTLSQNRCPFAAQSRPSSYEYNPLKVVESLAISFNGLVEYNLRWKRNVLELLVLLIELIGRRFTSINDNRVLKELEYVKSAMKSFITSPRTPKRRKPNLKFAIGMICVHKLYRYECVIRDWDHVCMESSTWKSNMGVHRLEFGENQPFYGVVAADFSSRYVAEENLIFVDSPLIQENIEEIIGEEFSHFNGLFYVPNRLKELQYPDDAPVRAKFYANKL